MNTILNFVTSPRFLSVVYHALAIGVVAGLNALLENVSTLGLPAYAVTIIGLFIPQIIGAINNFSNGQKTGFVRQ